MKQLALALFVLSLAAPVAAQQWEPFPFITNPQEGIKFRALGENLFFATRWGLYVSNDGGEKWSLKRPFQFMGSFAVLDVNPWNNHAYYFGPPYDSTGYEGLYETSNFGASWKPVATVLNTEIFFIKDSIYAFSYNPPNANHLTRLQNGTWQKMNAWPADSAGRAYDGQALGEHIWVAARHGVFHSPDAGHTWEHSLAVDLHPANPAGEIPVIEALGQDVVAWSPHYKRIYHSSDGGTTWEEASWEEKGLFSSGQHLFAGSADNMSYVLRFKGDIHAWDTLPVGTGSEMVLSGVGEHDGTTWLGTYYGVLRKTPNDQKWVPTVNGMFDVIPFQMRYYDGHLFTQDHFASYSSDGGDTWERPLDSRYPGEVWENGNLDYLLTDSKAIYRRPRNQRFEWSPWGWAPARIRSVGVGGDTLMGFSTSPVTDLFRSFDSGVTWDTLHGNLAGRAIRAWKGAFFATKDSSMYRSGDAGATWEKVRTFPHRIDGQFSYFYVVRDTLLLTRPQLNRIYYSTDGWLTTDTLASPQYLASGIHHLQAHNDVLILSMQDGRTHLSLDVGRTWLTFQNPDPVYGSIGFFTTDRKTLFFPGWRLRFDGQRQVAGRVFLDANKNGKKDLSERGVDGVVAALKQGEGVAVTRNGGNLSLLFDPGTDTLLLATPVPHYSVVPPWRALPASGNAQAVSFALQSNGDITDDGARLVAHGAFKAGFTNLLSGRLRNLGTVPSSGQFKMLLDPLTAVVSADPQPAHKSGDTVVWAYDSLPPLAEMVFKVSVRVAVVPPGTPLLLGAEVAPEGQQTDLSNDRHVLTTEVVSSYDPNDKSVSDAELPSNIADTALVYTIRFQNMGNAETDFVTVRDTLPLSLDPATVQALATSHPCTWGIEDNRVLVFRFSPVRLAPISVDSLLSQGFVQFSVKPRPGFAGAQQIGNTAHIYFDFNPAVRTGTAVTDIRQVVSVQTPAMPAPAGHLSFSPNPARLSTTVRRPAGAGSGIGRVDLIGPDGRTTASMATEGGVVRLDVSGLAPGIYWCRWADGKGLCNWGKLVVQ